jgi:hypothetical protein
LDRLAGYLDIFVSYVNVDLGANAKFTFKVNAGLDGKTDSRCDVTRIARLEVVDVHTVSMTFFAD